MSRSDWRYQVTLKTKAIWDGRTSVFIDAAECGNESRFINPSCTPNCELHEWEWANGARLGIFAAADIPSLQELSFRYREKNLTLFTCQCGQPNCVSKKS
ncbi:hypothetical protein PPTG_07291 [Phytophthora nicotianae INRA-310]|uniref:SET domain-containing protein n=1 Tax=Phytophthora nicotianae (strain INRA-310) TaxID=761204 RepID=W2QS49_PHYN3|nr:hypothetical protein PPTG_07291 [Phytophthora nicotianae INRA-310]ETN15095.1 hypothetical protein PPTG_07291 [Phytophthora nicotianae INRA-310]